ncbi:MAG: hypothetical protein HZA68_00570 [Rhodovulum sp.]|nr:hypothetical protein [Rhodovulum sp.]
MSEGFFLGLGLALILRFIQWAVPAMPKSVGWSGIIAGIIVVLAEFLEPSMKPPLSSVILFLIAAICLGGSFHFYVQRSAKAQTMPDTQDRSHIVGMKIEGQHQGGAAAKIVNSGPNPALDINAVGAPGQSVTGLSVTQTGPGTGLRIIQTGPGTGVRVTVGNKP